MVTCVVAQDLTVTLTSERTDTEVDPDGGRAREVRTEPTVVRGRTRMEASQVHPHLEEDSNRRQQGAEDDALRLLGRLQGFEETRVLHLEHSGRHGRMARFTFTYTLITLCNLT